MISYISMSLVMIEILMFTSEGQFVTSFQLYEVTKESLVTYLG